MSSSASSVAPIGTPTVRAAIAQAAQETGVDFDYLLGQAKLESRLDPKARAGTSSASGLYQFTGGTWLSTVRRHGAEHGLGWAQDAIAGGALRDPAMRAQVMALRFDPQASALMAGELAGDNRDALSQALGRAPDHAELYLAHFLGAQGAVQFLTALDADPTQSAAALLPAAASANRSIFYAPGGAVRSLGEVMGLLRGRLGAAMSGSDDPAFLPSPEVEGAGPVAREFHIAAAAPQPVARASMADTLRDAFALNDSSAAPVHVRSAYGRLAAFGM